MKRQKQENSNWLFSCFCSFFCFTSPSSCAFFYSFDKLMLSKSDRCAVLKVYTINIYMKRKTTMTVNGHWLAIAFYTFSHILCSFGILETVPCFSYSVFLFYAARLFFRFVKINKSFVFLRRNSLLIYHIFLLLLRKGI